MPTRPISRSVRLAPASSVPSTRDAEPHSRDLVQMEPAITLEPLTVRISTAMKLIGIGRSKLYELIASGDLEIVKVGTATLVTMASLRKLIAHGTERR